jgi:hypothetical protein
MAINCTLSTSLVMDCKDSMGGIQELYVSIRSLVTNISINPSANTVDDFTFTGGAGFYVYKLRDEAGGLQQTSQGEEASGTHFFERALTFNVDALTTIKRNELQALLKSYSIIVVKDNNGRFWLVGDTRGMRDAIGSEVGTGTAKTDLNGFTINLVDHVKWLAYEVEANAVTTNLAS